MWDEDSIPFEILALRRQRQGIPPKRKLASQTSQIISVLANQVESSQGRPLTPASGLSMHAHPGAHAPAHKHMPATLLSWSALFCCSAEYHRQKQPEEERVYFFLHFTIHH